MQLHELNYAELLALPHDANLALVVTCTLLKLVEIFAADNMCNEVFNAWASIPMHNVLQTFRQALCPHRRAQ